MQEQDTCPLCIVTPNHHFDGAPPKKKAEQNIPPLSTAHSLQRKVGEKLKRQSMCENLEFTPLTLKSND